ncbi:hypothetical protein BGZ54_002255 [Gamsiella multidivaricata]|nr:hypothetical protein BGZ54_002255 [Gamsiella multidivaricata]
MSFHTAEELHPLDLTINDSNRNDNDHDNNADSGNYSSSDATASVEAVDYTDNASGLSNTRPNQTVISFSSSLPPSLKQRPNPPARLKSDLYSHGHGRIQPAINSASSSNIHYTSSGQNSPGTSICSEDSVPDSPMSGPDEADLLNDSTRSPLSALNKRKSLGALLAANTLAASSNSNNIIINSASSSTSTSRPEVLSPTFRAKNTFQKTSPSFAALPTPELSGKKLYIPTSPRVQSPSAISAQIQHSFWSSSDTPEHHLDSDIADVDLDNYHDTASNIDPDDHSFANDADAEDDMDNDEAEDEDDGDDSWHSADEDFGGETSAYHSDSPALPLVPFTNQVGGHASFLRFSNKAICKPVSENEQVFYEYLEAHHPEVLPFIPAYLGVLNVTYRQLPNPEDGGRPGELVPEVVLEKNRHIVTDAMLEKMKKSWKWPSTPGRFPGSTVDIMDEGRSLDSRSINGQNRYLSSFMGSNSVPTHSSLPIPSSISSPTSLTKIRGLTRINLALKEKVLREVLSPHSLKARAKAFRQHFGFTSRSRNELCSRSHDSPDEGCEEMVKQVPRRHSLSNLNLAMASREEHKRRELSDAGHYDSDSGPRFSSGAEKYSADSTDHKSPSDCVLEQATTQRFRGEGESAAMDLSDMNNDLFQMDDLEVSETMLKAQSNEQQGATQPEDKNPVVIPVGRNEWIVDNAGRGRPGLRSDSQPNLIKSGDAPQTDKMEQFKRELLPSDAVPGKYILLEDLTDGLKAPCILDIKMGTRQYGIWANEKKMRGQMRKCQKTTSYETGIRICGMQAYNVITRRFLFQNKYYGRKLTKETLPLTLREFFYNGREVDLSHIPILQRKLKDLAKIIKSLNGYRFYASSLLIYYDGDSGPSKSPLQGVATGRGCTEESGLNTTDTDVSTVPPVGQQNAASAEASVSHTDTTVPQLPQQQQQQHPKRPLHPHRRLQDRPRTDLKVIDFAHCTAGIYNQGNMPPYPPMHPDEPDKGYLLGLKNLMMIFRDIWDQNGGDGTVSQEWLKEEDELWKDVWE